MILLNLIFLNQIFTSLSYVVVAWSLSLEVWLYALAPYLYKLSFKVLWIIIYASFIAFLTHIVGRTLFHWPYYAGVTAGINLLLFAFIWIAGFVYSLYPEKRRFIAINVAVFFLAYTGLTVMIELAHAMKHHETAVFLKRDLIYFAMQFLTLSLVYIVVFFNHYVVILSPLTKKIFNILGNISYPLYLVHRSVFIFFNKHQITNMALAVAAALVVAYLIYIIFDFYSKKREQVKPVPQPV